MTITNTVCTVSRRAVAERRAEREKEIARLGMQIAVARGRYKMTLTSELLAFLGFIHNTPDARMHWENQ
jgi:hypothetical protein